MDNTTSVILAGVGGQGVILISELLALAAIEAGFDATQTEEHGVSQRGGSVACQVRYSPEIRSPLVRPGRVDVILALEKLEGLRYAHYLREDGILVINAHEILPFSAGSAVASYPHHAIEFLAGKGLRVIDIAATEAAAALGNVRAANMLMLGALAACLELPAEAWDRVLARRIPARSLAVNQRAFAEGARLAAGHGLGSQDETKESRHG